MYVWNEMKWEMEMEPEEIETVLEKIWDIHDKLSDAIHSLSRSHYLRSLRLGGDDVSPAPHRRKHSDNNNSSTKVSGFVFVKNSRGKGDEEDDDVAAEEDYYSAVFEAKSLNGIRAALENLEDQLEFFHTVQVQQRAERDAAIARLEQSRIFLARRLSEHHGKKYQVIEEALAFVGDAGQFVSTNYASAPSLPTEKRSCAHKGMSFNFIKVIINSFGFAKKSLKINEMGGVLGNAALVAFSMLALLHLHQSGSKDKYILGLPQKQENAFYNRNVRNYRSEDTLVSNRPGPLDVILARG